MSRLVALNGLNPLLQISHWRPSVPFSLIRNKRDAAIYISASPSLRGTTAAGIGNQVLMTSHSFQDFNCLLAVVSSFQDFKCLLAVVSSEVADCCLLSAIVG